MIELKKAALAASFLMARKAVLRFNSFSDFDKSSDLLAQSSVSSFLDDSLELASA